MRYAQPGTEGSIVSFKSRYGNYIGGEFVAPGDQVLFDFATGARRVLLEPLIQIGVLHVP